MNRLLSISAAVLVIATMASAGPARAESEAELLQRVEDYLNAITTLDARFTQFNDDGSTAKGEFQLKRPQLARIAYDDTPTEMVARGQIFQIWDAEVGQFYEGPISAWSASILLQSDIDLDQAVNARGLRRDGDLVYLTVEPSDNQGAGILTLVFNDPIEDANHAMELTQWYVRDAQGFVTRVNLDSGEFGVPLANSLFDIDHKDKIRPGTNSG